MRSRGDDRIRSDDSGSRQIARSASVSEPTRPISVTNRRHNNSASEKHGMVGHTFLSELMKFFHSYIMFSHFIMKFQMKVKVQWQMLMKAPLATLET